MLNRILLTLLFTLGTINLAAADGVGTAGPSEFPERGGKPLYESVCGSCHMPEGQGAVGAGIYPPLKLNNNMVSATYLTHVIMYGKNGMPAFGHVLDDEQIADIVNYVRGELNSYTDSMTPQQIERLRNPDFDFNDLD